MRASKTIACALAAACCLVGRAQAENPIDIDFNQVFVGLASGSGGVDTMTATLTDNAGPADVRLEIDAVGSKTVYFVGLKPRQIRKLTVFVPSSAYRMASYDLTAKIHGGEKSASDRDYFAHDYIIRTGLQDGSSLEVLKLSTNGEGMSLDPKDRQSNTGGRGTIATSEGAVAPYEGTVKSAPERPIAYRRFRCVLLGPGYERLSDGVVLALKEYVLGGGVLAMRLPINDARWKGFAPAAHGAQRDGFGRVVLFQDPKSAAIESSFTDESELETALNQTRGDGLIAAVSSETGPGVVINQTPDGDADPFATTLPSFGKILGLLAGYFLTVVPINFLILKRMRRPELTWLTAPILAVVFAGVLFRGTKTLYHTPISTATHGVLVLQQGVDEGMFEGESDLFFPHAGSLSLGLKNVDATGVWLDDSSSRNYAEMRADVPLVVDSGTLDIPRFESPNLAFRELKLSVRVPAGDWIVFRKGARRGGVTPVYVENRSPYAITDATLYDGALSEPIEKLAPGATAEMDTVPTPPISKTSPSTSSTNPPSPIQNVLQSEDRVFLSGIMNDLPVGPQIGKRINSRTVIRVAAFPPADLDLKP